MNLSSPARVIMSNNSNHFKQLYKSPGGCSSGGNSTTNQASPSWRDVYKKRCFDEFKKSRQKLLTRFRNVKIDDSKSESEDGKLNTLKDYLDEELGKICLLQASSNEFISYEEAMEIYKQIQGELAVNPLDYDYESELQLQEDNDKSVSVTCPLCQKCELSYMTNSNDYIHCSNCMLKINTKKNRDVLTLECIASVLMNAVREHNCVEVPCFQLITDDDDDSKSEAVLMMSCDKCNYMKILF